MPNHFDKIFRENFSGIFLPFVERHLGIEIKSSEDLPGKLVRTIEREPDFLKMVETREGDRFVLQIEFQARLTGEMMHRMQIYHALLRKEYKVPILQVVLYFGRRRTRLSTRLQPDEIMTGYELIDLARRGVDEFLGSPLLEEIILAILGDFGERDPAAVVRLITTKLMAASDEKEKVRKALEQLLVLSSISNLEREVKKEIESMPLTIDISKSIVYNEGLEKGQELGMEKGWRKAQNKIARALLRSGSHTLQEIADITELPITRIRAIQREMKTE